MKEEKRKKVSDWMEMGIMRQTGFWVGSLFFKIRKRKEKYVYRSFFGGDC